METEQSLLDIITEYKAQHPDFDKIMDNFHISLEAYERALALMDRKPRRKPGTYAITTQGRYNVNVSTTS